MDLAPDEFRCVKWPKKFKIDIRHYDGTTNPQQFLQLYSIIATVAGADETIMTSWFPLALKGDAQTWFLNLPKNSIRSWRGLKEQFLGAFQGGYERPGVPGISMPSSSIRVKLLASTSSASLRR